MTGCVAIFGGSFNPPHTAHVLLVRAALVHADGAARVIVVPTFTHAFGKQLAPYQDRVEMCRLAFAPPLLPAELAERVEISDIERKLSGVSYTVETVRELRRRMPGVELRLLMGGDLASECATWRESDELFRLARPMFVARKTVEVNHPVRFAATPNNTRDPISECDTKVSLLPRHQSADHHTHIHIGTVVPHAMQSGALDAALQKDCAHWLAGVQLPAVSSTDARELLRHATPKNLRELAQLVPAPVVEYALAHRLY